MLSCLVVPHQCGYFSISVALVCFQFRKDAVAGVMQLRGITC